MAEKKKGYGLTAPPLSKWAASKMGERHTDISAREKGANEKSDFANRRSEGVAKGHYEPGSAASAHNEAASAHEALAKHADSLGLKGVAAQARSTADEHKMAASTHAADAVKEKALMATSFAANTASVATGGTPAGRWNQDDVKNEAASATGDHAKAAELHRGASRDLKAAGMNDVAKEHDKKAKWHEAVADEIKRDEKGRFAPK